MPCSTSGERIAGAEYQTSRGRLALNLVIDPWDVVVVVENSIMLYWKTAAFREVKIIVMSKFGSGTIRSFAKSGKKAQSIKINK